MFDNEGPQQKSLIDRLREIAVNKSEQYPDENFLIRGLWNVDYRYRPNEWERDLAYSMVYAQTIWQGCSYVDYKTGQIDDSLLGQDARLVRPSDLATAIAILDSVYAVFNNVPDAVYNIDGTSSEKAVKRAEVIVREVLTEVNNLNRPKVLNIGVMGIFIKMLMENGVDVTGADFDPILLRNGMNGAPVVDKEKGEELIASSDVVLATGMTLWTNTLSDIIHIAHKNGTKVILFAATGANFAHEYCNSFGVDVVVSEPQPQYMFQGMSTIKVYRPTVK